MKWILLFLLIFLTGCNNNDYSEIINNEEEVSSKILVEIKGQVRFPGIYELSSSCYLYEIIDLAGGLLESADTTNLNLVQTIDVSCSINIKEKTQDKTEKVLININYATKEMLMELPGIGEAYALRIIEYRTTNGLFLTIEEIKLIPGIKNSVFNQIKDLITV